jgi:hypothetical protein
MNNKEEEIITEVDRYITIGNHSKFDIWKLMMMMMMIEQ